MHFAAGMTMVATVIHW